MSRTRQSGVALITVLIVVAIVVTLVGAMVWQTDLDTRRTTTLLHGDQAMEYALGAEAWAQAILARDAQQAPTNTNLGQDWAQQLPPLPVDGGQITGHMEDMQGRFNLNNLSQGGASLQQFVNLLNALGLDPTLGSAVAGWMNTSVAGNQSGATDDFYSRLQPPYLTAQGPMGSISELMLVKGITPQIYAQLAPYVIALPVQAGATTATSVNLNTASGPVIQSLDAHISADIASQVIGERGTAGLTSLPAVLNNSNIKLTTTPVFTSSYFLLTVDAVIGTTHVTMYSLLQRNAANSVTTVRRTFGTL